MVRLVNDRSTQGRLVVTPIRVSMVVLDILAAIEGASPDDPPWGARLCEQVGYAHGTVHPALNKLLRAGWITDRWESQPPDRPRRRYYTLTEGGREAYRLVLAGREERRFAWTDASESGSTPG